MLCVGIKGDTKGKEQPHTSSTTITSKGVVPNRENHNNTNNNNNNNSNNNNSTNNNTIHGSTTNSKSGNKSGSGGAIFDLFDLKTYKWISELSLQVTFNGDIRNLEFRYSISLPSYSSAIFLLVSNCFHSSFSLLNIK